MARWARRSSLWPQSPVTANFTLGAQVGRILPFFSVLVPFWLVWAYAGFRGMKEIWPAIAVAGVSFAIPQFLVSNYHGPWLTDIIAALSRWSASSCS